jgi:splicing factor 3B subunit 3
MHLYNLTLQKSNAVTCAVHGSFSSPKEQEVVVSHGQAIELLRPDADGKLLSVCHMECFGLVRSMAALRLPGANTDCVALGSDSGRLALVHYVPVRPARVAPPCLSARLWLRGAAAPPGPR